MADYEEVMRATGACLTRLFQLEKSFFSINTNEAIPMQPEILRLMDSLNRAQREFENALVDRE